MQQKMHHSSEGIRIGLYLPDISIASCSISTWPSSLCALLLLLGHATSTVHSGSIKSDNINMPIFSRAMIVQQAGDVYSS